MTAARSSSADHAQLEKLFRQYYELVRQYLLGALRGDTSRADDLVQEVFMAVLRTYRQSIFDKSSHQQEALLLKMAKNAVIDMWRREGRLVFCEDYQESDIPLGGVRGSEDDRVDTIIGDSIVQGFIEVAVEKLTVGEYRVAFMSWVMDCSDDEIAETLRTTVPTVRTHKWSARKKLKACVNRDGYEIRFFDRLETVHQIPSSGIGEVAV